MPKIIEHMKKNNEWGRFFPMEYSPFAYNDSLASEYFPLSKEEVLKRGGIGITTKHMPIIKTPAISSPTISPTRRTISPRGCSSARFQENSTKSFPTNLSFTESWRFRFHEFHLISAIKIVWPSEIQGSCMTENVITARNRFARPTLRKDRRRCTVKSVI